MFSHPIHDSQRRILSGCTRGLGSYRQWVDQCLWVMLANVRQQVVDISMDVGMGGLDTSNDLQRSG